MGANVEWTVGVIRAGADFEKFGDCYSFSATVLRRGDEVEIIGASGETYPGYHKDIIRALKADGVSRWWWERLRDGAKRTFRHSDTKVPYDIKDDPQP